MTYSVNDVVIGAISSLFGVSTWMLPYENFAPNVPSWVISTLFLWYLVFPFLLTRVQRWSDEELAYSLVEYFWFQIGLALLIGIGFGGLAGSNVSYIRVIFVYGNFTSLYI